MFRTIKRHSLFSATPKGCQIPIRVAKICATPPLVFLAQTRNHHSIVVRPINRMTGVSRNPLLDQATALCESAAISAG